jgi:hypothetical protein
MVNVMRVSLSPREGRKELVVKEKGDTFVARESCEGLLRDTKALSTQI